MLSTRSQLPLPPCYNCALQPLRASPARSIALMGNAAVAGHTANAARHSARDSPIVRMPNRVTSRQCSMQQPIDRTANPKIYYGNDMDQSNCPKTPRNARNQTFQFLFEHFMFEIGATHQSAKAKMKYTNLQAAKKIQHNSTKVVRLTSSGHTSVSTMAPLKTAQ